MEEARQRLMISRPISHVLVPLALAAMSATALAASSKDCTTDCVLTNRSEDQNCALEKTPLTRCENFDAFRDADSKLNKAYSALLKQIGKAEAFRLRTPQRAWIVWRNEQCEEEEDQAKCNNGVCAGVAHGSCILNLTYRRTKELSTFSKDIKAAKAAGFRFEKVKHSEMDDSGGAPDR